MRPTFLFSPKPILGLVLKYLRNETVYLVEEMNIPSYYEISS